MHVILTVKSKVEKLKITLTADAEPNLMRKKAIIRRNFQ